MRISDAKIYLAQPLFGRKILTGPVIVGTTWLDYTFNEPIALAELEPTTTAQTDAAEQSLVRMLIPLNNVLAVIVEQEKVTDTTYRVENFLQKI